MDLVGKVLRAGEGKKLRQLDVRANDIGELRDETQKYTDEQLLGKTAEFRGRLAEGETLEELLPETFACVREASRRTLAMEHFPVQLVGGMVLHEGKIAEMRTGEGKTLVATLAAYLNALEGKGVHLVTVNDYLAKRDAEWMGPIYRALGMSVGVIQTEMDFAERREAYNCDITYGTNSEFGFDYLRDNMVTRMDEKVQRGHHYAIVDEVDSILVDEARTPLIISGQAERAANTYYSFANIVPQLKAGRDYEVDEKHRTVAVTEEGVARVEKALGIDNLYDHTSSQLVNHLQQALKAHALFKKDVDYMVKDGEVIIVDEFTGRLMVGRRYSEGLHQAIEAKEKVKIQEENQTLATITLQNYFRMYEKLAGMTGTAMTEEAEFRHIYKLETVEIPTNRPMIRDDMRDLIYKSEESKFTSAIDDIAERHAKGQPVLVGTISIEKSEHLSKLLRRRGIKHEVLNAKYHEREAAIIAQAGRLGAVTIATNMAGRGVDIMLGGNPEYMAKESLHAKGLEGFDATAFPKEEWAAALSEAKQITETEHEQVVSAGGLHVLGTERHESRRIDNQLRGRCGRQGDPGSSQFFLSLEDDLMRLFGSERIGRIMERLDWPDDMPIEHGMINKSIETAQRQVESQNFEARKHVLQYDDVMNKQRELIYAERNKILEGDDLAELIEQTFEEVATGAVQTFTAEARYPEEWDLDGLFVYVSQLFPLSWGKDDLDMSEIAREELTERLIDSMKEAYAARGEELGAELLRDIERVVLLQVIDAKWREHLYEMDYLREGIGLRAVGQRDPLVEYTNEGFAMFEQMIGSVKEDFINYLFHVQVVQEPEPAPLHVVESGGGDKSGNKSKKARKASASVGRNAPCPCGSGKKYKKCCGA
ncbi:MAG: preprotein translocase subunit SecA [Actinobacteria bacterium]|nr:MAG: preprotein translocase subunit SecA [Actinomycetota bacterium]